MTIALRLCPDALAATKYEIKHPSGQILPVGRFELERLSDGDINETIALADSRRGEWIGFVPYKRKFTYKPYR